jgi:hypothetical protein
MAPTEWAWRLGHHQQPLPRGGSFRMPCWRSNRFTVEVLTATRSAKISKVFPRLRALGKV